MSPTLDDLDNHSDQLNPNNDAYWQSRGGDERPDSSSEHLAPIPRLARLSRLGSLSVTSCFMALAANFTLLRIDVLSLL
jgi:hypothetical protein